MAKSKKSDDPQITSMDQLLKEADYKLNSFSPGEIVSGIITEIKSRGLFVDIGGKSEGIVGGKEISEIKEFTKTLKVGDKIKVQIKNLEDEKGQILLSLKKVAAKFAWEFFQEKAKTGESIQVYGKEINRGGIVVIAPFGLFGFIPGAQIGKKWQNSLDSLIGKKIEVKVLEVDEEKNRLVFSERLISEPEKIEREEKVINKLKIGQKFKGKITRIEPFGLFIKVKEDEVEIEGLVHISEVSWEKIENLSKLYQKSQEIEIVLVNKEEGRLQFSIKRLTPDPWEKIDKKYPLNEQTKGTVTKIAAFGALVRLEPGIEGLVHISKIPPETKLKLEEKVSCYIESLNKETRKLSLGLVLKEKPIIYK